MTGRIETGAERRTRAALGRWVARVAMALLALLVSLELGLRAAGAVVVALRARAIDEEVGGEPATVRILHVGESTTYGYGVEPSAAYPVVLTQLLERNHPGRRFVAFNRGLPGLTTTSMVDTLPRKLEEIAPDFVVIMAGANDFNEYLNGLTQPERGWFRRGLEGLRLYRTARLAFDLARPEVRLEDGELLYFRHGDSANILYDPKPDPGKITRITRDLEHNLTRMIDETRAAGAQALLVGYIQAPKENEVLERVARRAATPYVSTFMHERDRSPDLFVEDGWHPSPTGHHHVARAIARAVEPLLH